MTGKALSFQSIHVRKMPGFSPPGFKVADLSPGINVIHGPNGCGKSTLARSIHALLWPRSSAAPRGAMLEGEFTVGGTSWSGRLEDEKGRFQREGAERQLPDLPPPEARDRYNLFLHEFLQENHPDRSFADTILRESAGGYDVLAAAESLGFRDRASNPKKAVTELRAAKERLTMARGKQDELWRIEARLSTLREERKGAEEAAKRARLLELAIEYRSAVAAHEDALGELEAYPEEMARLAGQEEKLVKKLREELEKLERKKIKARGNISRLKKELEGCGVPEAGIPEQTLLMLQGILEKLKQFDQAINDDRRRLTDARETEKQEARALGDELDEERLATLDLHDIGKVTDLAKRAVELHAQREAARSTLDWLRPREDACNLPAVRERLSLLGRWLRASPPGSGSTLRLRTLGGLAGALAGLAGVALAVLVSWPWIGLTAAALALVVAIFWPGRDPDPRSLYRKEYEKLGLPVPGRWDPADVETLVTELEKQRSGGILEEEKARRREEAKSKLETIEPAARDVERQRQELIQRLGAAPDLGEPALFWFVERVSRWKDAHTRAAAAKAGLDDAHARHANTLEELNAQLSQLGERPASSTAEASAIVKDLERRCREHELAQEKLAGAKRELEDAEGQIARKQGELHEVFQGLGLDDGDEATLASWCRQREDYLKAARIVQRAETLLRNAERKLEEHPDFDAVLKETAEEDLKIELREAEELGEKREGLAGEIGRIEGQVEEAKEAHDVEDALSAYDERLGDLLDHARGDQAAVAGDVLAEYLRQQSRDQERPRVFHRARDILQRITQGRYRLEFEEDPEPTFRAVDTVRVVGQGLDELSSATRLQLLLAVRLAFVETHENGWMLPLLLDETLANSDHHRARAIMVATVELARQGRQVFCFTAQDDEVSKWLDVLSGEADVPHRVVDLAAVRELPERREGELRTFPRAATREVPEPDGMTHLEYEAVLDPPPIDPRKGAGAVHIWHLVEDPAVLHGLLKQGIERWGQLRLLLESGGEPLLGDAPGARQRVEGAAGAVDAMCRLWQAGRGTTVDRTVLEDSGALTQRTLGKVTELAKTLSGDARELLSALEAGGVKHLHRKSIESLREYLEEEGYVTEEEPLTPEQIRIQVTGTTASAVHAGDLDAATLEMCFDRFLW